MSTTYLASGRAGQKRRTWQALVDAARELIADGDAVTIDDTAARAGVSRATAYRYFPTRDELLVAAHPEIALTSLLPDPAPPDVRTRLDAVATAFIRLIVETEPAQRAMLRSSLAEPGPLLPLRGGRGIGWIAEALQPAESTLGRGGVQRLARAVRSAIGIEALVWLTDVGGLSRTEAAASMRWSALAMLEAALRQDPALPRARAGRG